MPEPWTIEDKVYRDHTKTLLGRVVGDDAQPIAQADLSAIAYTVYALDPADEDNRVAITGHTAVAVTIASVIFDTLQTDAKWDKDATGYNFAHTLDISSAAAFPQAGVTYLVVYTFTPSSGQPYVGLAARLRCV
jgi:hypothetical protein